MEGEVNILALAPTTCAHDAVTLRIFQRGGSKGEKERKEGKRRRCAMSDGSRLNDKSSRDGQRPGVYHTQSVVVGECANASERMPRPKQPLSLVTRRS